MQILSVLGSLKQEPVTYLTINYLVHRFGLSRPASARILRRMHEHALIRKLRDGLYYNDFGPPPPNLFLLHQPIVPDSYVSFQTAMHLHGIVEQATYPVLCARWLGAGLQLENDFGSFWYTRIPRQFVFGFEDVQWMRLATPEKAFLDYIWKCLQQGIPPRTQELHLDGVMDPDRFLAWGERMGLAKHLTELGLADPRRWPELEPVGV